MAKIEINSEKYFVYCGVGGILACGNTHFMMTPIDMLKCRLQVNNKAYRGIVDGLYRVGREQGVRGLFVGGLPTYIGYSLQGMGKYGFYELFKYKYGEMAGAENARRYKTSLYLAASATAEFLADIMLCPFEAIKVQRQTAATETTITGFSGLYRGIVPLWFRQIPYTMVKFASFENIVEGIYTHALSKPKEQYSKGAQLGVTFAAGYMAGILCAIVSHPADTVVSKLNNMSKAAAGGASNMALIGRIITELGPVRIWTGLGPRIFMIGTLTAAQWLIYDSFKVRTGLPTTGGDGSRAGKA
ncbi:Cu/Pi carrier [Coemansia sp. BCRC 34490]|nr:Cu/Pi carrier [Coemansia sp. Benny D160-2]KAJ2757812.1 Cu/Pi carrier [Coemansia sp. BCRC 34490]